MSGWEEDKKLLLPLRATSDHVCNAQLIGVTRGRGHCTVGKDEITMKLTKNLSLTDEIGVINK